MTVLPKLPVAVCGEGPVAARVFTMLQGLKIPVVQTTRVATPLQASALVLCGEMPLQTAFAQAMNVLGQGVPLITDHALLVAVHGQTLHNASLGQQARWSATAALGMAAPMAAWLPTARVGQIWISSPTGPNAVIQRMVQRDETVGQAQTALEAQQRDMTDANGKRVYVQGVALHHFISVQYTGVEAQRKGGLEGFDKNRLAHMRRFGLAPVFAVGINASGVDAGVVATTPDNPLLEGISTDTMVAETTFGTVVMKHMVVAAEAQAAMLVAEVQAILAQPRLTKQPRAVGFMPLQACLWMLVGGYAERYRVLEMGARVVDETLTPQGDWLAVVEAEHPPTSAHWSTVPIAGGYQPEAARLRLVG